VQSLPPVPDRFPDPLPDEVVDLLDVPVVRIYRSAGPHALLWDQARESAEPHARFDPHGNGPAGVWYAGCDWATSLAECFQETRVVAQSAARLRLCIVRLRSTSLLDLGSAWSTRAKCGSLLAAVEHEKAQPWAAALRRSFPHLRGLMWPSSVHPPGRAVVLWTAPGERPPLAPRPQFDRAIDDPAILQIVAACTERIGVEYALPPPP
jgi:RES domain-containing protein